MADGGHIELILGPMFSGKSTELLRRMNRYRAAKRSCLLVKHDKDDRYSQDHVTTHDQQASEAFSCDSLGGECQALALAHDVIGIDEGQFFKDLPEVCEALANTGKIVIVAALDGTWRRTGFGNVEQLVPLAENVVKLSAVCSVCFQDAAFSKRLTAETADEVVGGADKYVACCRDCFRK